MKTSFAILLSVVLVASIAFAAGTSTGGTKPTPTSPSETPDTATPTKAGTNPATGGLAVRPCEDRETAKDRVLCRLQQGKDPAPVVEESCRGVPDPSGCQTLYGKSEVCYKETGKAKDACFKRVIGFSNSAVRSEASKNQAGVRQYVVLLLYDVQEKIEDAHEAGTITDEEAAGLIDSVVTTKQAILNNAPKADIKAAIAKLRADYTEVMQ